MQLYTYSAEFDFLERFGGWCFPCSCVVSLVLCDSRERRELKSLNPDALVVNSCHQNALQTAGKGRDRRAELAESDAQPA